MTKILLVEDDKSLREIYGTRLYAEGYDIVSAGDGEEALAMAIKERPQLIISDVMMPKISGFDMLDILRSTTETKDIKVIMMTALSSEDQRSRGEALGADRYLVKSQVGIEDVVRTVHEVLGDSAATPAAAAPAQAAPVSVPVAPVVPAPIATPAPAPVAAPPVAAPVAQPQVVIPPAVSVQQTADPSIAAPSISTLGSHQFLALSQQAPIAFAPAPEQSAEPAPYAQQSVNQNPVPPVSAPVSTDEPDSPLTV